MIFSHPYQKLLEKDNPLIKKIIINNVELAPNNYGYEANVYFHQSIKNKPTFELYGNNNGTGSDFKKTIAVYKAISESLERFAYFSTIDQERNQKKYGYIVDSSTNGFSAYPGLNIQQAKKYSIYEALERWCLMEWWYDQISVTQKDLAENNFTLYFEFPKYNCVVCILGFLDFKTHSFIYGFSGGKNHKNAKASAHIEAYRNLRVIRFSKNCTENEVCSLEEQKLLYFAKEGHKMIFDKINSSNSSKRTKEPRLILETEIRGEWCEYATVYRTLFESELYTKVNKKDFFLF